MKSLEMAKKSKEFLKAYRIKLITEINQDEKVYGFNNIGAKDTLKEVIDVLCWYDRLEKDLEVLEILRKYIYLDQQCYDYDWEDGGCWIDYLDIKDIDDIDEHYQEDFNKIKQWLEENEK